MLNDFLHVREYEQRVREHEEKIKSELRYVQNLLLAETGDSIYPHDQAKIDVYVEYIKLERKREQELLYMSQRLKN